MGTDKARENRLRRWAARLGVYVRKSRARTWHFDDRGGYRIVDPFTNTVLAGEKFDLTMDDVEEFLQEYEARLKGEQ